MDKATQRISKDNIDRVNEMVDGKSFDQKLGKILDEVEYYTEDLIEEKIDERLRELSASDFR